MTDQLATVTPILPTLLDTLIRGAEREPDRAGHTARDYAHLLMAGIPPEATQPRERAVACWRCGTETFNQHGACDRHYERPEIVDRLELLSSHGSDS